MIIENNAIYRVNVASWCALILKIKSRLRNRTGSCSADPTPQAAQHPRPRISSTTRRDGEVVFAEGPAASGNPKRASHALFEMLVHFRVFVNGTRIAVFRSDEWIVEQHGPERCRTVARERA